MSLRTDLEATLFDPEEREDVLAHFDNIVRCLQPSNMPIDTQELTNLASCVEICHNFPSASKYYILVLDRYILSLSKQELQLYPLDVKQSLDAEQIGLPVLHFTEIGYSFALAYKKTSADRIRLASRAFRKSNSRFYSAGLPELKKEYERRIVAWIAVLVSEIYEIYIRNCNFFERGISINLEIMRDYYGINLDRLLIGSFNIGADGSIVNNILWSEIEKKRRLDRFDHVVRMSTSGSAERVRDELTAALAELL